MRGVTCFIAYYDFTVEMRKCIQAAGSSEDPIFEPGISIIINFSPNGFI